MARKKDKTLNQTEKVSVSFHPDQLEKAMKRAAHLGFANNFSDYIQKLVDQDLLFDLFMPAPPPEPPPPIRRGGAS